MTTLTNFCTPLAWVYLLFGITGQATAQVSRDLSKIQAPIQSPQLIGLKVTEGLRVKPAEAPERIQTFCSRLKKSFKRYSWLASPCGDVAWKVDYQSPTGHPLVYAEFGNKSSSHITLFLSGVHPDELTPIDLSFRFANYLHKNPKLVKNNRVIVAPLVNPDGFLNSTPRRTNSNGVDINRNFPTRDWYDRAMDKWTRSRSKNPRYFPGNLPNSEIETLFQIELIDRFHPDKIISVHAPLGFLDYDGPGDQKYRFVTSTEQKAKELVHSISRKTENYKVVDYSFYPGSLGNFAGNERSIPTITLELETTRPSLVRKYWNKFLPGLMQSIHYPFESKKDSI